MKTLTNHTIIYDDEYPLCCAYTKVFVTSGMLDEEGRVPYAAPSVRIIPNLDLARARNEIALVNKNDNSIHYGIDSLLHITGNRFPVLKSIFKFRLFRFLIGELYFFISFNRKVIAPGKRLGDKNACTPDVHYSYRLSYIVFAWLISSIVLVYYAELLIPVIPKPNLYREFIVCGGQIVFQGIIVTWITKGKLIQCYYYLRF